MSVRRRKNKRVGQVVCILLLLLVSMFAVTLFMYFQELLPFSGSNFQTKYFVVWGGDHDMMVNIVPSTMTAVVSPQTGLSFQSYSISDTSYYGKLVIFEKFIPIYAVPVGGLYPLLVQDVLEGYKGIMIEWEGTHIDGISVAPVPQKDMDDLARFCGEYPNVRIDVLVLPKPDIFSDDQLRQLSRYNIWFDFEISYSSAPSSYVDQVTSRVAAVPNLNFIAYLYKTNSLNSFTDSGLAYLNSKGLLEHGVGYFNWNRVNNYTGMRSLVKTMLVTYFGQGSTSSIIGTSVSACGDVSIDISRRQSGASEVSKLRLIHK